MGTRLKKNRQGSNSEVQVGETRMHIASCGEGLLQQHLNRIQRWEATETVKFPISSLLLGTDTSKPQSTITRRSV